MSKAEHSAGGSGVTTQADFNEFWEQFKAESDPGRLQDALNGLISISRAASDEAQAAAETYFADVARREKVITGRIAELNTQRSALQEEINALKYPLTTATANEDAEVLDGIRGTLKQLEADKAQIAQEIELLQSAYIRGADGLYAAVKEKNDHYLEKRKIAQDALRMADDGFIKKYAEVYGDIDHLFRLKNSGICGLAGYGADMEKLDACHNAERVEQQRAEEAKERAERQRPDGPVIIHGHRDSAFRANPGFREAEYYERDVEEFEEVSDSAEVVENKGNNSTPQTRSSDSQPSRTRSTPPKSQAERALLKQIYEKAKTLYSK